MDVLVLLPLEYSTFLRLVTAKMQNFDWNLNIVHNDMVFTAKETLRTGFEPARPKASDY